MHDAIEHDVMRLLSAQQMEAVLAWWAGKASARASLLKLYMTSRPNSWLAVSIVSRTVLRNASSSLLVMQSACSSETS